MSNCTRCDGAGFLNAFAIPENLADTGIERIQKWLFGPEGKGSDVQICDCCGNGEEWYGEPGSHYTPMDPPGKNGPYAYNGGLCECH